MKPLIKHNSPVTDEVLNAIAHIPTRSLPSVVETAFFEKLSDGDFLRVAFFLAQKSFDEGGCPIGAVIVDNKTHRILGKGHNTLVQDNDSYNHGETAAIRDAGRQNFAQTTLFSTLSPCDVCAALLYTRQFDRIVIGDVTNACGNEDLLRARGVKVDVVENQACIALYDKYRRERPDLDLEDWRGLAAVYEEKLKAN